MVTEARPPPGSENLILPEDEIAELTLPSVGEKISARAGSEQGYLALARVYGKQMFVLGCDLDPSTKLQKASMLLPPGHYFEMSIEEQASAIMANGLAMSSRDPQFVVFSTFAAFFEGIAREGLEMWRYQRNLNGINEGLNVMFHMSHVGACTGRDHFSGWALDWITLALGYLPYLYRFYAPADARAAFLAVKDAASSYGAHILGVPRDSLPILAKQESQEPLWSPKDKWEPITVFRKSTQARKAILAFGAPAFLAAQAFEILSAKGTAVDVYTINGLPLPNQVLSKLFETYPEGIVTIEDGIIATRASGLRGFAGMVSTRAYGTSVPLAHIGITDPRIAPSDGHMEVWEHFGITTDALILAVENL